MEGLLSGRQPTLHQVDASATALQASLTSPQLDKRLTTLHDHWTAVNQKVRKTKKFQNKAFIASISMCSLFILISCHYFVINA